MSFEFIAIGDITTDAFIKLSDAHINKNLKDGSKELCVRFADKIPYDKVTLVPAVGNAPNAAVAAARLGLKSALHTNLGDDMFGEEDLVQLKKQGVATDLVRVHKGQPSNYHFVLWFKAERTILVKHYDYEYKLEDLGSPWWIYVSSLGEAGLPLHDQIADYLEENPDIKMAFQPGTFQIKCGYERLERIYKRTEVFFCNVQEAQDILESSEGHGGKLAREMVSRGPKIACITDGPLGAFACDGTDTWFMPIYPDENPPYERTGAGDAFSSTVAIALSLGKSLPEALRWGPINSMSAVQKIGAQEGLLTREQLLEYLEKAPVDYQPKKL